MDPDTYFESYGNLSVHETMLRDTYRNECYRKAIFENKERIENKIVMDVGAGSGILSIFCAQAGAKKVYAIEPSPIFHLLKQTIAENNFENIIEAVNETVENLTDSFAIEKVDVIVSEWMGHYLFHEAMLDSVIYARDRFLKAGGSMFPEIARLYVAPCSAASFFDNWENVNGVSMKSIGKAIREEKGMKPCIVDVHHSEVLATEKLVAEINLNEVKNFDEFKIDYLEPIDKCGKFQAVCLWFECDFPPNATSERVTLSTSPLSQSTHWKQTLIVLPMQLELDEVDYPIAFHLSLTKDATFHRTFNICLEMIDPNDVEHPELCNCLFTKCILLKTLLNNSNS